MKSQEFTAFFVDYNPIFNTEEYQVKNLEP